MPDKKLTFRKNERLTGEIRIKELFDKGSFFLVFPFRIGFLPIQKSDIPVEVVISAPKRNFKRAVKRNRIKRQTRECYRKNKSDLYSVIESKDYSIRLSIHYVAKEILSTEFMEKKWKDALAKLIHQLP
jgi:ribonuclease P protein component